MPPSESTFLMGWDIATGQAHMFELADTAEVHDHSGKWIDDKTVSLVRQARPPIADTASLGSARVGALRRIPLVLAAEMREELIHLVLVVA